MLLVSNKELERSKEILGKYKKGEIADMSPELWRAKKVVDSTIHPDTGEAVLLPFRMSAFVLTNLVVTAGMLTPGLGVSLPFQNNRDGWRLMNEIDDRHLTLANSQPISQRSHQSRQRQQIRAPLHLPNRNLILPRRRSCIIRRSRPKRRGPSSQERQAKHKSPLRQIGAVCCRGVGGCA